MTISSSMNTRTVGWLFVGGQGLLLIALIALPSRDDWATPPWVDLLSAILTLGGFVVIVVAALRLGPALTPTPEPNDRGELATAGLYRYVRHPIYTGVLAVVAGLALRSGSWFHVAVAVLTYAFFDRKAAWEEDRLLDRYDAYSQYAAVTPRFVPRPWRLRRES